jgi:hypothetical protein
MSKECLAFNYMREEIINKSLSGAAEQSAVDYISQLTLFVNLYVN